ncbi:tRNA pseudouridine(38/39) synthase-like [Ctenocephalides felis]|uniref:tRNA pseudouridine(38/39) synthase-like n=1 Tax=Ctenocephalides felis TaxID=7515 RepID=UPI000E6E3F23|nr:tRNA pseudouridine(38/39) synthase-like [Ctenocephalides felis]
MTNVVLTKNNKKTQVDDLQKLDKEDLIAKIIQLEAHNTQLKNIIQKSQAGSEKDVNEKYKGKGYDFANSYSRHILLKFYYLGWDYNGYASQEDSTKTIEYHLFKALTRACLIESRQTCNYHRCGRTDKGVSAFSQVISLDIRSRLSPEEQMNEESRDKELNYCHILNRLLPSEIRCVAWAAVKDSDYSARFNCKMRTYHYYFPRGKLNINVMQDACKLLIGSHDFRNLCKMDVANGVIDFMRTVKDAEIICVSKQFKDTESGYDMFAFKITSKAFLWHQIRCIMAILLLIGNGCEEPSIITELFDVEKNGCKPQYSLASDVPLNLYRTRYDLNEARTYKVDPADFNPDDLNFDENKDWCFDRDNLRHVIEELQGQWTQQNVK